MAAEIDEQQIEQLLKGVSIPPRPTLLLDLGRELRKPEPDLRKLAELIGRDVGISAATLKTINSPLFGLRNKVGNVLQAVNMLGLRNTGNIVTGLVLRNTLGGGKQPQLERFWDTSEKVASIAAYVCSILPRAPKEEAYTFGIFRDCGIPLLMQRFPDYRETLRLAAGDIRPMTLVEDEHHGTNHAVLGFMVARSWGLPDTITQAILRHHEYATLWDSENTAPAVTRTLVAVNFLAEHLHESVLRLRNDDRWEEIGHDVLDYLGLSEGEFSELKDEVLHLCSN